MKKPQQKRHKKRNVRNCVTEKQHVRRKTKKSLTIWLRNKMYKFLRTKMLPRDSWGICTDPSFTRREIKVHKRLRGLKELEVIVHEMLHACFWDIDEKVIKEVGVDISKALWKMGYRR